MYNADNEEAAEWQVATVCVGLEFAEPEWLAWCLNIYAFDNLTGGSESLADFAKKIADIGARCETLESAGEEFLEMLKSVEGGSDAEGE
jgi:hypothetical protein